MKEAFWIPITFSSEETEEKIQKAVEACWQVHVFTLDALNDYFKKYKTQLNYRDFRGTLAKYIAQEELIKFAQQYSLRKAAEQTFPYFSYRKSFDKKGKLIPVAPIYSREYTEIQIQSRKIWAKYMVLNNLITTVYGSIYLGENWGDSVERQAVFHEIPFSNIPDLMHSITIDIQEKHLCLNLHNKDSRYGRKTHKNRRKNT